MIACPPLPAASEVHLWFVRLVPAPGTSGAAESLLSEPEQARARRFVYARDRLRFVMAHAALRRILASYLGIEPTVVELLAEVHGKPFLSIGDAASKLAFNLSHSEDLAVIACATDAAVGVDVERVDPAFPHAGIAERFFSAAERHALRTLPVERQPDGFFRQWTCKEAYAKGLGLGLSHDSQKYTISVLEGQEPAIIADEIAPDDASRWQLAWLPCPAGYVGAASFAAIDRGARVAPQLRIMSAAAPIESLL